MEERIDIVTVDRVDATSAQKIRAIADAADAAQKHLDALNRALGGMGAGALGPMAAQLAQLATLAPKAAQAQVQLAQANERAALSWLRQEEALSKAITAEQRMEQAIARTSVAQSAQSVAAAKANVAYLEQERALFRALEAEQNYAAATSRAELAQLKLQVAQDKVTSSTAAVAAATRPQIQTLEELGRALGHTTAQTWEFIRAQSASADRPGVSPRMPFMDADLLALGKYNTAVLTATDYTERFEAARRQVTYSPFAAGLSASVTTGYGSLPPATQFGRQNPFGPTGAPTQPATSGFAQMPGNYSVTVQSVAKVTDDLVRATGTLADREALLADKTGRADKALGGFAQRGRLAGHEMANLGYQLQDIVVSLAGGQNPFMVLLQQGAQIQAIYSMRGESVGKVFGDVAGILARMINPATVVAAALGGTALAIGLIADKAGDIQRVGQLLGMSSEQAQILQKTLNQMSRGNMGFGEFTKEAKDFALALDDATRNPKSQLARLFEVNNKSLTDSTGKLKSQNDLWKMSVDLIRGAANEVQAIRIGEILGLQEDFTREIYKSKQGFEAVKTEVTRTGTILDDATVKKAAAFEKAWADGWVKFKENASSAITQVEAMLFDMLSKIPNPSNGSFYPSLGTQPPGPSDKPGVGPFGMPIPPQNNMNSLVESLNSFLLKDTQWDPARNPQSALQEAQTERQRALSAEAIRNSARVSVIANRPDAAINQGAPSTGGPARADLPGSNTIIPGNSPPKEDKTAEKRADALARINRELESQLKLMGMLGPERAVEQQMAEITNSLAIKHITLTEGEKTAIHGKLEELQQMQPVQAAMNKLYEDAAGPLRDYNALVEAGSKLLADGKINAQQYQDATRDAWERVLEQQNTVGAGIELGFMQTYDSLKLGSQGTADYVKQALGGVEDAFVQLASTGKITFESLTTSILADISRMIFRLYILKPLMESLGLGTTTPSPVPSPGLGAPGTGGSTGAAYDNGADFTVGGSTGKDRNLVMFRATRGERVRVTPADHNHVARAQRTMGGQMAAAPVQVQVINNSTARVSKVQETRGQDGRRLVRMIVEEAKAAVAADIQAGGTDISKSIENRFGVSSAAGIQI